ncbi:MAG: hypothetical protein KatS3mg108_3321 [Isosphaeraceae bacterium]|jgi:menaquinol-cytochrome c reductase iron-sulfur subunit|nr:MAG: hypothetical protein KatS3mg108_3321 [Isosphaeraceae bacterium]
MTAPASSSPPLSPLQPDPPSRRRFYALATNLLGGLIALLVGIPGVRFLLDPLGRRQDQGGFRTLPLTLAELEVGVPRQVPIVEVRTDAWVKYPPEPVGSVWLVRQSEGSQPPLVAFSAECPHLGCAVNLAADGQTFICPCHASAFRLDGQRLNEIPPRPLDQLEVDPESIASTQTPIRVKFERFRTGSEEKIPLA